MVATLEILDDKGAPTTAAVLSEFCSVRVGQHYATSIGQPLDQADVARKLAERHLDRPEPMAAEEFFQRHHTAYLRLWNQDGKGGDPPIRRRALASATTGGLQVLN